MLEPTLTISQETKHFLPAIVRRLVDTLSPERVYLFGSQARGDSRKNSDIDIIVVVPHSDQPGYIRDRAAYHALWDVKAPVEVLVWTREEFDSGLRIPTSLSATVQRTGRLLYER